MSKSRSSKRASKAALAGRPAVYSDRFEVFWKAYPRHENKRKAYKSWVDLGGDDEDAEIARRVVKGAGRYRKECEREGTPERYMAHAATWLNQARWEDYEYSDSEEKVRTERQEEVFFYGGERLS